MQFIASVQPWLLINESDRKEIDEEEAAERRAILHSLIPRAKAAIRSETGREEIGKTEGECACDFRLARENFMSDIQEYSIDLERSDMEGVLRREEQTRFNMLVGIKQGGGIYLPAYFFYPLWVKSEEVLKPVFLGSAPRLTEELRILDKVLNVEKVLPIGNLPDYMMADEEAIEDYESSFASVDQFWVRFSYILLRRVADRSVERGLPIFINAGEIR